MLATVGIAKRGRPSRFIGYPTDSLLGVVDSGGTAAIVAAELKASGIPDKDITVMRGGESAARFDAMGAIHGIATRIRRLVSFTVMDQLPDMAWYEAAIRGGQAVVMAKVRGDQRKAEAVRILKDRGAHFVNYYGRFATEEIVRWQGPEPEVHDLLKR